MGCLCLHLALIPRAAADTLHLCLLASIAGAARLPFCPLTWKGKSAVKAIMHVMSWCLGLSFNIESAGMCVTSDGIT